MLIIDHFIFYFHLVFFQALLSNNVNVALLSMGFIVILFLSIM